MKEPAFGRLLMVVLVQYVIRRANQCRTEP